MKTRIFAIAALLTLIAVFSCEDAENIIKNGNSAAFLSLTADGSSSLTTKKLVLTFDKDITGLDSADIVLSPGSTGASKNAFQRVSAGVYELSLKNVEKSGDVTVSVSKAGFVITGNPKQTGIFYKEGSGNGDGGDPADIPEELIAKWWISQALADSDDPGYFTETYEITQDGKLILNTVDSGYTITVSGNIITVHSQFPGVPDETVTYGVSGTVLTLTNPSSMSAALQGGPFYKKGDPSDIPDIDVYFNDLTQNSYYHNKTDPTTKITLSFAETEYSWGDKADIENLTASDIYIDSQKTGAVKGNLTRVETGKYELALIDIIKPGNITVSVAKEGYNIIGNGKTIYIWGWENTVDGSNADWEYFYGVLSNKVTITRYLGNQAVINVPSSIDGRTVTALADGNSSNRRGVFDPVLGQSAEKRTAINLPESLEYIGSYAFNNYGVLVINIFTTMYIPNNVSYIGDNAFDYITSLEYIVIPESVRELGQQVFYGCNNLNTITIGSDVILGNLIVMGIAFNNAYNIDYNKEAGKYVYGGSPKVWTKVE